MSTLAASLTDSRIMLGRNLKHTWRNPLVLFNAVLFPVVVMLLFVKVFGGAFAVGENYVDFATPGMLILAVSYGLATTAVAVNEDMSKGVINRFRTMDVSRGAILTGHVVVTTVRCLLANLAIVAVAFLMGFDPAAGPLEWLAVLGLIVLVAFAASWLTIALGLAATSAEAAGLAAVPLILLPFLSSTFVPVETMGTGLRQFAEYQPFTPIIDTLRGLLLDGHAPAGSALAAVAWCVGISLAGYLWSVRTFSRRA
ncbi:ABC transporter permease [Kineosporia sp. J2-2]|uniref:Transport permease protein n=1 Tax=Kineosporia corallincola TaxID=2835133 RepID=A0ABS5TQB2_9ACTN|nr:ABC transporter permease [Kineosporia corallincola]MBT0773296.1 ABC transporter permease [Kineosporia corallincola]